VRGRVLFGDVSSDRGTSVGKSKMTVDAYPRE
jgi:hypothetical protein